MWLAELLQMEGNMSGLPRWKENRLPWMILRLALLAVGVAAWLWVYLGQFGIHR